MQIHGFTINSTNRAREIITECAVSLPYMPGKTEGKHPPVVKTKGLWDTGATRSVITKKLATDLGLKPIGNTNSHHAGGTSVVNVYLINLFLPNNVAVSFLQVTECVETIGRFGVLIGMDVISQGDLAISNYEGKTTVSFRIPSVKSINLGIDCLPPNSATTHTKKDGTTELKIPANFPRNRDCPCGSKKKYKNCHGKGK